MSPATRAPRRQPREYPGLRAMPDHQASDPDEISALAAAAGAGDRQALEALLERYRPQLEAFVRLRAGALLRQRESSADLVQSVCREVLQHGARFRHPDASAFRRWLFTTAMRKLKNRQAYWLAGKRDPGLELQAALGKEAESALLAHYRTFSTPSAHVAAREEIERVERAFDSLSEEQREVITLAHLAGLSRREIAEQMEKSEVAVRTLLHRALAKISGMLADEGPE